MVIEKEDVALLKRKVLFRDTLTLLGLLLITVVLYIVTFLLFRSFESHRAELAVRWSDRGKMALQQGKPQAAIADYRTALTYDPDNRSYEMMLAQALGAAGHTDEAYNYFVGLWDARPGDGFLNLQLARLLAKKGNVQEAINYYHASVYGTWEGDGVRRRHDVRLELARYLIQQHEFGMARTELLAAGGNTPDSPETDIPLARLLEQASAPQDALAYYKKALASNPKNTTALEGAGRLSYEMGDFPSAHRLLGRLQRLHASTPQDDTILAQSERLLQLAPSESLPARERVTRILTDRQIAQKRLNDCMTQLGGSNNSSVPGSLLALNARWTGADGTSSRTDLLQDSDKEAAALQLIYDTEIETSQSCSAPTGDDALLLKLAQAARTGSDKED